MEFRALLPRLIWQLSLTFHLHRLADHARRVESRQLCRCILRHLFWSSLHLPPLSSYDELMFEVVQFWIILDEFTYIATLLSRSSCARTRLRSIRALSASESSIFRLDFSIITERPQKLECLQTEICAKYEGKLNEWNQRRLKYENKCGKMRIMNHDKNPK